MKKFIIATILVGFFVYAAAMAYLAYERPPLVRTHKPVITYTVNGREYTDAKAWKPIWRGEVLFIELPHAANRFHSDHSHHFVIPPKGSDVYSGFASTWPMFGFDVLCWNPTHTPGIDIGFKGKMEEAWWQKFTTDEVRFGNAKMSVTVKF